MSRSFRLVGIVLMLLVTAGCCRRVLVEPAVDLKYHEVVGLVRFSVNQEGKLGEFATRKFLEAITRDQKNIQIVELGDQHEVLLAVGQTAWGPDAVKAVGDKYDVRTVITGNIELSDIKPHISFGLAFPHIAASADVNATLTCKMQSTDNGATVWSGSGADKRTVGSVTVFDNFFHFDAEDPEAAYGELVKTLITRATVDFRRTWHCVRN